MEKIFNFCTRCPDNGLVERIYYDHTDKKIVCKSSFKKIYNIIRISISKHILTKEEKLKLFEERLYLENTLKKGGWSSSNFYDDSNNRIIEIDKILFDS